MARGRFVNSAKMLLVLSLIHSHVVGLSCGGEQQKGQISHPSTSETAGAMVLQDRFLVVELRVDVAMKTTTEKPRSTVEIRAVDINYHGFY